MSSLDESAITDGINGLIASGKGLLGSPIATAIGGAILGSAVTGAAILGSSSTSPASASKSRKSSSRSGRKIKHTKKGWKQDRSRRSKQKWEVAYQKRKRKLSKKSRSRKGIHYTKNGQPYKIMSSGKTRFIKRRR